MRRTWRRQSKPSTNTCNTHTIMKTIKSPSKVIIIPRPPQQNQQTEAAPQQAEETAPKTTAQNTKETASSEKDTVREEKE